MPTKQWSASSLCTATTLIVAGGVGNEHVLAVTEVMNTESRQWSTAIDLPEPMLIGSLNYVLMIKFMWLGDVTNSYMKHMKPNMTIYIYLCTSSILSFKIIWRAHCKITIIHQTWCCIRRRIYDVPVRYSPYVSLQGQLLAFGGLDSHTSCSCLRSIYQFLGNHQPHGNPMTAVLCSYPPYQWWRDDSDRRWD